MTPSGRGCNRSSVVTGIGSTSELGDPVVSGLAYALNRAYHAWIRTQPQLILDLWPDESGLDETQPSALRLVEPVPASPCHHHGGGLVSTTTEQGANLTRSRALLREGA